MHEQDGKKVEPIENVTISVPAGNE